MDIIVLAAGSGKRMKSGIPKVLNRVDGKPMIKKIVDTVSLLQHNNIFVVVGKDHEAIKACLEGCNVAYIIQPSPRGTGDAVKCVLPYLTSTQVLVLNGDVPNLTIETLNAVSHSFNSRLLLTFMENPSGMGRYDVNHRIIIEEKDCDENQKQITLVNCGVYLFDTISLKNAIPQLIPSVNTGEYYLTDVFKYIKNVSFYILPPTRHYEIINVNTLEDLERAKLFNYSLLDETTY